MPPNHSAGQIAADARLCGGSRDQSPPMPGTVRLRHVQDGANSQRSSVQPTSDRSDGRHPPASIQAYRRAHTTALPHEGEFFRRSSGGHEQVTVSRRSDIYTDTIGCSPSLIIGADHHLSDEQACLLGRGPTYVPSCFMHVSPSLSFEETWSKQWSLLRQQLTLFFSRYSVSINRKTTFQAASKTLFQESFSAPLPTSIQIRAAHECRLVRSVRRPLADEQLILRRTADDSNVFYLGRASEFQAKADDYLKNNTSFEKLSAIDEHTPQQPQLEEMLKSIDAILQNMRQNRQIGEQHLRAMQPKKILRQSASHLESLERALASAAHRAEPEASGHPNDHRHRLQCAFSRGAHRESSR
ncbi:unnamed protein product [Didymodactylos carnosus]|uniref:Uncharacterized protein n=1 Tax=Didymodactylos carnosus TaxID=1234261 RepID=A0A815NXW3_9BILA|nr:unnamed protein product [Didymodactylos carnosus]CAF1440839.1 unnamed protein product [Didymodactylos carnosus]CAF4090206.1 unnamed protein product [Didymodactylos carnosus]CAF4317027.1 unnamed protein product [Didymodactylos carnosus]